MFRLIRSAIDDLSDLVYPRLCAGCGIQHPVPPSALCAGCQLDLPRTDYHLHKENPMTRMIRGRFPFDRASAMFYFTKDSGVQHLMHRIKYLGRKEAAWSLGRAYGRDLRASGGYAEIRLVIPVPLHPVREHERGYNQSAWFGRGIAEGLGVDPLDRALERVRRTETQTHKSRMERLANTEGAFRVRQIRACRGKHVLLVDDVMTTGATLEACALPLLEIPGVRVSLATLAIATD